jgi:hypothetical protein
MKMRSELEEFEAQERRRDLKCLKDWRSWVLVLLFLSSFVIGALIVVVSWYLLREFFFSYQETWR